MQGGACHFFCGNGGLLLLYKPVLLVSKNCYNGAEFQERIIEYKEEGVMYSWEKIKSDLQKGVEEGLTLVREGASVVKKKAEELTEEGKKRYRLFELKTKVQKEIAELGGKVYDLSSKVKNPMLDSRVKTIMARIGKLQVEIMKLEGKPVTKRRKTAPRKRAVKKATRQNTSVANNK